MDGGRKGEEGGGMRGDGWREGGVEGGKRMRKGGDGRREKGGMRGDGWREREKGGGGTQKVGRHKNHASLVRVHSLLRYPEEGEITDLDAVSQV